MIDGILQVDKEEGITSYDVIRRLKGILGKEQKIGHAGTLDPLATGLLLILLGRATKMEGTIHSYEKVYDVEGVFGYSTDTQDIQGSIIKKDRSVIQPSKEDVEKVIDTYFLGQILQTPPQYSAKKVGGRKAYELARKGENFSLKPVSIYISQFEIVEYTYPVIKCRIKCSSGTYVRTVINDLGEKLGSYATVKGIRRISIGAFNVSEAIPSSQLTLENKENILRRIINI